MFNAGQMTGAAGGDAGDMVPIVKEHMGGVLVRPTDCG